MAEFQPVTRKTWVQDPRITGHTGDFVDFVDLVDLVDLGPGPPRALGPRGWRAVKVRTRQNHSPSADAHENRAISGKFWTKSPTPADPSLRLPCTASRSTRTTLAGTWRATVQRRHVEIQKKTKNQEPRHPRRTSGLRNTRRACTWKSQKTQEIQGIPYPARITQIPAGRLE
jgi:hypothetical protein